MRPTIAIAWILLVVSVFVPVCVFVVVPVFVFTIAIVFEPLAQRSMRLALQKFAPGVKLPE